LQLFSLINPKAPKPTFYALLIGLVQKEGITAIYAGLSASLMRQAVYGTARIGLHRTISNHLLEQNHGQPLSFAVKTLSGMASGSIAVCLGTPFDVAMVRMQADTMKEKSKRRGYKNVFDAIMRVAREEGFRKLYSGIVPNIGRGMSMNVGMMAIYDQVRWRMFIVLKSCPFCDYYLLPLIKAKEFIGGSIMHESLAHPSLQTQLGASMIAGFTASAFSLPFDMLKSRLRKSQRPTVRHLAC
jgi:solute carrier family 25 oxoglutarate transporter 11